MKTQQTMDQDLLSNAVPAELEEHLPDLLRFARSMTGNADLAADVAQESMVRALQRDSELPAVRSLRGWLFQIAANVVREWWRKQARQEARYEQLATLHAARQAGQLEDVLERREYLEQLWQFVDSLPGMQRRVLVAHMIDGLDHKQIANRLSITTDNVKATLNIARRKLRTQFLNNGDSPQ